MKADIVCNNLKTRIGLDKYLKDHPETNEVFRHVPWCAGTLPKVLAMKANEVMQFLCTGSRKTRLRTCLGSPGVLYLFVALDGEICG